MSVPSVQPTPTAVTSARVLTGARAALGVFAIAVPFIFHYPWDLASVNNVVCGLLILAPLAVMQRYPNLRFVHVPLSLWISAAPFAFHSSDGALYSNLFIGHTLLMLVIPTPEVLEP